METTKLLYEINFTKFHVIAFFLLGSIDVNRPLVRIELSLTWSPVACCSVSDTNFTKFPLFINK